MSDVDEEGVLDLWVRAGCDNVRNGGCPACHQIFMILLLKSQRADGSDYKLHFNVKTVNPNKPLPDFRAIGLRHVPAIVHGLDRKYEQPDEILEYIDFTFPKPDLTYPECPEAEAAVANIFSKFCFFIKDVNKDPKNLEAELRKLNNFLTSNDKKYLCADYPTHLDCQILPKLHHIRLACEYLKNYKIPADFIGLWRYLKLGYETNEFAKSCPSDQDVLLYWADRPDTKNLSAMEHKELSKQEPRYTLEIPSDIRL